MIAELLHNTHTGIWIVGHDIQTYCSRTAISNITFEQNNTTLLLYEHFTKYPYRDSDLLKDFHNGYSILITHVEVGRRDVFENNDILIEFYKCRYRSSWIPDMTTFQPPYPEYLVQIIFEIEAFDYKWLR